MAHNDTEIELKIKLEEKDFARISKLLQKKAKFIKKSHHVDDYYTPMKNSFLDEKYPYEWLTLRKRDGVVKINYKHWYPENTKYTTHCDEYEVVVEDKEKVAKIFTALNYWKFVTVNKTRMVYEYKDELEIAMDKVVGLGHYIEVETIKDFGTVEKARAKILAFTRSLGLLETKTVPGGYGFQLMKKKGLVKK